MDSKEQRNRNQRYRGTKEEKHRSNSRSIFRVIEKHMKSSKVILLIYKSKEVSDTVSDMA